MKGLVIDASAALALILDEGGGARARDAILARRATLVPWVFWLEVVNVLARRQRWEASEIMTAVHDLETLGLRTEAPSRPILLTVVEAVQAHGLTAYDAAYLVLAETADGELLTADAALATAAGARAIFVGQGHQLAEARARYDARPSEAPDWSSWPGAAAYVLELRREVEAELAAIRARQSRA